jgi:hypothetical protein
MLVGSTGLHVTFMERDPREVRSCRQGWEPIGEAFDDVPDGSDATSQVGEQLIAHCPLVKANGQQDTGHIFTTLAGGLYTS